MLDASVVTVDIVCVDLKDFSSRGCDAPKHVYRPKRAFLYILSPIRLRNTVLPGSLTDDQLNAQCALSISLALHSPLCALRFRLYTSQTLESLIGINLTPVYPKLRPSRLLQLSMSNRDDLQRKHYCSLQQVVTCLLPCTPRMVH